MKNKKIKKRGASAELLAESAAMPGENGGTISSISFESDYMTKPTDYATEAAMIFARLQIGRSRAIRVDNSDTNDKTSRCFRRMVSDARKKGTLILNKMDGKGYYIADMDDPDEVKSVISCIKTFKNRAREMSLVAEGLEAGLAEQLSKKAVK